MPSPTTSRRELSLPLISVVIPVLNDAARLRRCLTTIAANRYPRELVEIIVVDNGSSDGSREVAASLGARVLEVPHKKVAGLRNLAARSASGAILAFIDADHEIVPDWFEHAAALLDESSVAGVGAACVAPHDGNWVQRHYEALRGPTRARSTVEWLGSGNLAVRRTAFDAAGGFDERLETCEDVDLCQRLRSNGGMLIADQALKSVHLGDPDNLLAIFRGELWRGRDNLRVSLRGRLSLRAIPSLAIPVIDIVALAAIVIGAIALTPVWSIAAAAAVVGLAALRAAKILANLRRASVWDVPRALVVALAYDLGRALALLVPASHGVRRSRGR